MHPKALLEALRRSWSEKSSDSNIPPTRWCRAISASTARSAQRERATLAETPMPWCGRKLLFEHLAGQGSGPRERRLAILGFAGRPRLPQERAQRTGEGLAGPASPRSDPVHFAAGAATGTTCRSGWSRR
jgi:16S rRNA (cytosine967-C5)-methyltransferase